MKEREGERERERERELDIHTEKEQKRRQPNNESGVRMKGIRKGKTGECIDRQTNRD